MPRVGQDLAGAPRAGRRAGPRQRRARPARRLLHGLARDAEHPRHRLRHPLRVRHLRSGDSRRLAGRAAPTSGCASATRGKSLALGDHASTWSSADAPSATTMHAGRYRGPLGARARWSRASPTTRRCPAIGVADRQPAAALEGGSDRVLRLRRVQRRRLLRRRGPEGASETISKVLYPNDEPEVGKQLRLDAAVLLRVVLAAGHDPAPSDARQDARASFTSSGPRS